MSCDEFEPMLSAYVDGELAADDRRRIEEHLAGCEACRQSLAELNAVQEDLAMIKFREPSDAELERYWQSVYNRLERGIGWVLLSLGVMVLLCYGAFMLVERMIRDPKVALALKVGVVALIVGAVVLFVSLLRERLAVRKTDKYSREVDR